MASYKDTIPQFNPYIQQRPVEAMKEVGMYKQQRYDQGVQKIQESIDNIAGLDVARPQDKQYLQSKLNQLGSQLSSVAGGDFSNFQLVNSVNGMTNQIAKDNNVISAVSNAARYKSDLQTIEKLKQEGKWADSNQFEFSKNVNAWYENPEISVSYSANVSPYVDTTKEATDIVKALAKDYTENDVAFTYDNNGNIISVLDVMTRQKIEGITPEKIATALKTGLSPQAWRQLSIDGKYKYSNVSPEQYVNQINSSYEKTFSMFSDRRKELINAANIVKTQEEKNRLMLEVNDIDRSIEEIKNEYNSISRGFESGDVESSQAQYYTTNWLENMSNAMSSRRTSNQLMESPYFSTDMKKKNLNLQERKHEQNVMNDKRMYDVAMDKLIEQRKANYPFGTAIPLPDDKNPKEVIRTAIENVNIKKEVLDNELQKLARDFGWSTELKPVLNEKGEMKRDDDGNVIMMSEAEKEINNIVNGGPSKSKSQIFEMARLYYNKNKDYELELTRLNVATDEANKQVPFELNEIIPDKYKDKTWLGYNVNETIELMQKFYGISKEYSNLSDPAVIRAAKKLLPEEEFRMYKYVYKGNTAPLGGNPDARSAMLLMNSINSKINDVREERNKLTATLLEKSTPTFQRVEVPIILDNPRVKAGITQFLGSIEYVISQGKGWPGYTGSLSDIQAVKENLTDARFITEDKSVNFQGEGGKSVTIPLTDEQWNIRTAEYQRQVNASPGVEAFNSKILPQMLLTNLSLGERSFWTTALPTQEPNKSSFNTNFDNAYFKSPDFPSIKNYNVSGNFVTTENPSEDFSNGYFYLNIDGIEAYDKQGKKAPVEFLTDLPFPATMTKSQMFEFMQTITDEQIYNLIQREYPQYNIIRPKNNK